MLHDTHVHLDLLLERLDILPKLNRYFPTSHDYDHTILDDLLKDHEFVLQASLDANNFLLNKFLTSWNPKVKYLFGMHPDEINLKTDVVSTIAFQTTILQSHLNKQIVGIGEVGLDYSVTDNVIIQAKQKEIFEGHLDLAVLNNLPVAIHVRDVQGTDTAMLDVLTILERYPQLYSRFAIHCFTGNYGHVTKILEMGGYFGLGGVITYPSGKDIANLIPKIPLSNILIETDLPFLSPVPHRGETCKPAFVQLVGAKIAGILGISEQLVWEKTRQNAGTLFGL